MDSSRPDLFADELLAQAGWIRALAGRLVTDAALADDLVQETLVAALEKRPRADRPLRPWLSRVLRKRLAHSRRSDSNRRDRERDHAAGEKLPSSEELLERAERQRALVDAVVALSDPYRSVLLLRFYEGRTPAEIAEKSGVPAATVRSQLRRGLAQVREALDEEHDGNRSAWCVALLPFVDDAAPITGAAAPVASVTASLLAMNVALKITAAAVAAGVLGFLLLRDGGSDGPDVPVELASVAAPAIADDVVEEPQMAVDEAGPENAARQGIAPTPASPSKVERSPVHGTLVDTAAGLPLVDYRIEISATNDGDVDSNAEPEIVTTGPGGVFTTEMEYEAGVLHFALTDHPTLDRSFLIFSRVAAGRSEPKERREWQPGDAVALTVDVGPVYDLVLRGPFEARTAELVAQLCSETADEIGIWSTRAPVRRSPNEWVRFGALAGHVSDRADSWLLRVTSTDGRWQGETRIEPGPTGELDPVVVDLAAAALLEVDVTASQASALRGASATVRSVATGERWNLKVESRDGDHVLFRGDSLVAGDYELQVRSTGFAPFDESCRLLAGETTRVDASFDEHVGEAYVRGVLKSRTGTYRGPIFIQLVHAATGNHVMSDVANWKKGEEGTTARFAFEHLVEDEYRIELSRLRDQYEWTPSNLSIRAPAEGIVLTCEDAVPTRELSIDVVDAETNEPIEGITLVTRIAGRDSPPVSNSTPRADLGAVPDGVSVEWRVSAAGYVPAWGDETSFVEEDGTRVTARLARGWGARFEAFDADADPGTPLADVEIRIAGELAGTTNADGVAYVYRDSRPQRVDASRPGWRLESGDLDLETGEVSTNGLGVELDLVRNSE